MIVIKIPEIDGSIDLTYRTFVENKNKTISIKQLMEIPNKSGLYFFYGKEGELLYIGKAKFIRDRIKQHLNVKSDNFYGYGHNVYKVNYILVESSMEREIYETYAINTLKPKLNFGKLYEYNNNKRENHCYIDDTVRKEEEVKENKWQDIKDDTIKEFYL